MSKLVAGRLNRQNFWIYVAGLTASKIALKISLGYSTVAFDILLLAALIARFHDFDLPAWVPATLFAVLSVALPIAVVFAAGVHSIDKTNPGQMLLLFLPIWCVIAVAGSIPGDKEDNRFGPADQGLGGFFRRDENTAAGSVSAYDNRLNSIRSK